MTSTQCWTHCPTCRKRMLHEILANDHISVRICLTCKTPKVDVLGERSEAKEMAIGAAH